jgi:hypothetical protein
MSTTAWAQRELIRNPDTFATSLLLIAADKWGYDCFDWAAPSLRLEFKDAWQVDIPENNLGKLLAAIRLVTGDEFYRSAAAFVAICNSLYGQADFESFDPADPTEILMGVTEALLLWPPAGDTPTFSLEVQEYISHAFLIEGYEQPVGVLRAVVGSKSPTIMSAEFADDPEMFTGIYQSQQARAKDLEQEYFNNVRELIEELSNLKLANGNTSQVVADLRRVLVQIGG